MVATAGAATAGAATAGAATTGASATGAASAGTAAASGAITNPTRHVLAYVTETKADAVAVLDTQASPPTTVGTISLGATCHPQGVTASPTLAWVFVDCTGRTSFTHATVTTTHGAIDVIDTATNTVVHTLALGADPIASAISPTGKTLYAVSFAGPTSGASVGSKFVVDVLHATSGALTLSGNTTLPGTQWVNPLAIGAIAVGDGGARVAVATSGSASFTARSGAVDVYTVATGKLSTPPHQYAFSGVAPWALAFNPAHPTVLYVSPGYTTVTFGTTPTSERGSDAVSVITVTTTVGPTPSHQFSWPTLGTRTLALFASQFVVSPDGRTIAVTLICDGSDFVGPLTVTPATPLTLGAVTTPTPHPGGSDWVYLGTTSSGGPMGAALLPSGANLYVVLHGTTGQGPGSPGELKVLDAVTKVTTTVTLGTRVGAAGVAFGQPPAPAPPTTTTTTTVPPTTTTVPPTTTTVPVTTTTVPTGPQLAYTGEDVAPWAALGGSLVVAGLLLLLLLLLRLLLLLLLLVDLRRRAPGRHRLP